MTAIDLGHEDPTILLTNHFKIGCPALITRYAQRMLIENDIAEVIQFFHVDALSSLVGLRVDLDLQITLMASSLYRLLAEKVGGTYRQAEAKTLFHNLLDLTGSVVIEGHRVVLTVDKRSHNPLLVASRFADEPTPKPWFRVNPCASVSLDPNAPPPKMLGQLGSVEIKELIPGFDVIPGGANDDEPE